MIPGIKRLRVVWRGESLDLVAIRERNRKQCTRVCTRETSSLKPLTRKLEWLIIAGFYKEWSSKSEVLEVCTTAGLHLVGIVVLL